MKLTTLYAGLLLFAGVALLFAPEEMRAFTSQTGSGHALFAQVLGAALIGFAASNWVVRHSPLGGIYGRAIVVGNLTFSLIGALALLGSFPPTPGPGFWGLLAVFVGGAVLYGGLLLRRPGGQ